MADTFRVVKTNRKGKNQERVLSLDFATGSIVNKNTKGKVQNEHSASSVLFVECEGALDLVVHLPKKKEYKLTFPNTEERGLFQEKLIALCAETKKMNMPQEEEIFDPNAQQASAQLNYTFSCRISEGKAVALKDAVVYVDIKGLAICDPKPVGNDATSESYNVVMHYPFTRIRSWTNEGFYVVLETVDKAMKDEIYKLKFKDAADAPALVEAVQVCLAALMKRMAEEKAAKKAAQEREQREVAAATRRAAAAAAGGGDGVAGSGAGGGLGSMPDTPAPKPKKKAAVTRADRIRRASLVVDMAAMADGISGGSGGAAATGQGAGGNAIDQMQMGGMSAQSAMMAAAVSEIDGFVEDDADSGVALDIVAVMAESQAEPVDTTLTGRASIVASRRASVMADISGAGGEMDEERRKRSGLLKDLAAFVDDQSRPDVIAEGDEEEEDEDV